MFTYDLLNNPRVAYVRLLIPDTVDDPPKKPATFSDEEIEAFYNIQQGNFQSSMFFSGPAGRNLPFQPVSVLRVAALAIGVIASNSAKLAGYIKLLDVTIDPSKAAEQLRAQADNYRKVDDEAGAFAILEQVTTVWGYRDRWYNQLARQTGGGLGA